MSCERCGFDVLPSLKVTSSMIMLKAVCSVRFQVHTAVLLEIQEFRDVMQVEKIAYEFL
jgi:hypothetical protein